MISLRELQQLHSLHPTQLFQCQVNLNLYDGPDLTQLATQAIAHRYLRVESIPPDISDRPFSQAAIAVRLCEDEYPGWLPVEDLDGLSRAATTYEAIALPFSDIQSRLPQVLNFAYHAMQQPNHYLWGGTVGPNFDCSGLTQTAFASVGIWLPRDAYQQEAFGQAIDIGSAKPGDLVFFGPCDRCTHVGLYLGDGYYIHSSGKDMGRNGIGIDRLTETDDPISQGYGRLLRGLGRVMESFQPQVHSIPQRPPRMAGTTEAQESFGDK